jgi:MULE transposase domain
MLEQRAYQGMRDFDPKTANVRYHLLPSDNATLYRKFSRQNGIDIRQKPEYNIDNWLNPDSPDYQPEVCRAIFHYHARHEAGERFEVCISTKDMDDAARKYAHRSQLVLDGTFGVCTSRLLLFIGLAQDENRKGVPIVFFLFSAPTGNRATHAGYNTQILCELLTHWRRHLSKNSQPFEPSVAITDTDTKERGALLLVWPNILLLICKFHLRQCWTNHRKTAMRCTSSDFWKESVRNTLYRLETE